MDTQIEGTGYNFDKDAVVAAVLDSGVLGSSNHQIKLFLYLINARHEGNISRVKAYNIAVDAFGRPPDFDGSIDSIVRVEMFRLRANLRAFNDQSDGFQLNLPKASYKINIQKKLASAATVPRMVRFSRAKRFAALTAILPFLIGAVFCVSYLSAKRSALASCSATIPNIEVINKSRPSEIELYVGQVIRGAASQYSHLNRVENAGICLKLGLPNYALEYTMLEDAASYRGNLTAKSLDTGEILAVQNIWGNLNTAEENGLSVNDDLFFGTVLITNDWLKPHGVIHRHSVKFPWRTQKNFKDYICIFKMYESFVSDADNEYGEALECLENAYQADTKIVDNLGGLIASYIDQQRGIREPTIENPTEAIYNILSILGENWDDYVETTVAMMYYEAERSDFNSQRFRDVLRRAEERYSTNPVVLVTIAIHAGFQLGDWELASRQSLKVKRIQSERDNSIFFVDAATSLLASDSASSFENCVPVYSENSILSNLLVNACAVRANEKIWVSRTNENLHKLGISTTAMKVEFFENGHFDDVLKKQIFKIWNIQA